jgi:hypothetical protein
MKNHDRCGRCGVRHGGNDHYCRVHGPVSAGCCSPSCQPEQWVLLPVAVPGKPWGAPTRWQEKAASE